MLPFIWRVSNAKSAFSHCGISGKLTFVVMLFEERFLRSSCTVSCAHLFLSTHKKRPSPLDMPGINLHAGMSEPMLPVMFHAAGMGGRSKSASNSCAIHSTLRSFSLSLKVQVEYMSRPPGFRQGQISAIISRCNRQQCSTFVSLYSAIAPASFLNIPSPEQGTSARMASNCKPLLR